MKYYFVNTGHEFGEDPFSEAKPFLNIKDAEVEFDKLENNGDYDVVALYSFDSTTLKIETIKCNFECNFEE